MSKQNGGQNAALLRLLRDEDRATRALVKEQLASGGIEALPRLRGLLAEADERAAAEVRAVLGEVERRQADALFQILCQHFGEHGDLEEAAWRLAATFLPGDDFSGPRALLETWGAEVARRLPKAGSALERAETLVEFLAHEQRFRGNTEDYYNVVNSLLPEVLETRVGLPITLSLVYLFVGRRAGLPVEGIGLPGHFVVRCGGHFFDPFHGGRPIGLEECRAFLEQHGQTLNASHLRPATPRAILLRILTNLYCLAAPSDPPLAAKLSAWMEALRA